MTDSISYLLRQAGEQRVAATGWIGEHPADHGDVAHLLLYPLGHGIAAQMRAFATGIGFAPALAGPPVTTAVVHLTLDPDGPHVQLRDVDDTLVLERPVSDDWATVATDRGYVMTTIGQDGHTGRAAELGAYLARGKRLYMAALVALQPPSPTRR